MNRFANKTVLVTGGTSGIGLAAALAYAAEGAHVIVTGRDEAGLEAARQALGPNGRAWRNDAASLPAARDLAAAVRDAGLRLDAVFINAGVAKLAPFEQVDEALWDQTFDINVKGAYFQLQALLPVLNDDAAIVLNGSINAHIGMPTSSVYAASKAALISFAKTLSAELLPRRIRVNVVSPGPVKTPLYNKLGMEAAALEAAAESIRALVPLKRFATPEEIGSTVLHLSAAESAFIIGTEVIVDGGMGQL
jgi:NAD(P)-dependent dehydrogenase (short-subunit alcohol dehydrogenase family)